MTLSRVIRANCYAFSRRRSTGHNSGRFRRRQAATVRTVSAEGTPSCAVAALVARNESKLLATGRSVAVLHCCWEALRAGASGEAVRQHPIRSLRRLEHHRPAAMGSRTSSRVLTSSSTSEEPAGQHHTRRLGQLRMRLFAMARRPRTGEFWRTSLRTPGEPGHWAVIELKSRCQA